MMEQPYDKFIDGKESEKSVEGKSKEKFLIHRCPTPGCSCRRVRPLIKKGRITGFTCGNGCRYTVKRNQLTGEIDYYELTAFNHYRVDSGVSGFRTSLTGAPYIEWH